LMAPSRETHAQPEQPRSQGNADSEDCHESPAVDGMRQTAPGRAAKRPWHPIPTSTAPRVPFRWRWWPYALLQPILTIALFVPDSIPFLDAAAAGAFVLFARGRPGVRAWAAWLVLAVCIGLASRNTGVEALVRAAGFAGILVLGFLASSQHAPLETRDRSQEAVGVCLAIPVMGYALLTLRDLHLVTYDPVLARIDAWAPPVAWKLARAFAMNPGFRLICHLTYFGLPLALVLVGELERGRTSRRRSVFVAAAFAAVIGALAYQIVPATGPKYAFAGYPPDQPVVGAFTMSEPLQRFTPRNAMPSLHVTWAMLIGWHAARQGWIAGTLGAVFLVLTSVAALAMGEHYLIDLAIAVPFAIAVGAAVAGHRRLATTCFLIVAAALLGIASRG
jgi:hypothetical protein